MEKLYLQLTSGRGPRECAYVVAQLLDVISKEAKAASIRCVLLNSEVAEGAGPAALPSATLELEGPKAQALADQWLGTIQWIGASPYRPTHRRRNWFIGVACIPVRTVQDMKLSGGVIVETMRASGPGGQNVNKTNSAVRVTHAATGLSVTARESRSQIQNRKLAELKLERLFQEGREAQRMQEDNVKWAEHQAVERGNPRRIFRGQDFRE